MQLPEECNFNYPNLFWKEKANRFTGKIPTQLFKESRFNLGERLDHFNHYTFAYFQTKDGHINEIQHKTLTHFLDNQDYFKKEMESAIVNYINKEVKELLEPSDYTELLNKKVGEIVLLHHVHLPYSTDDKIIGFEFECVWDYEHGFGVKFHNDVIANVGMADTAF